MTLILETGGGVQAANAYITVAFLDAYLTERDRATGRTGQFEQQGCGPDHRVPFQPEQVDQHLGLTHT